MAEAKLITHDRIIKEEYQELVTKVRNKIVQEGTIQLTMSMEETSVLKSLLGRIGGWDGPKGVRTKIDSIYDALKQINPPPVKIPIVRSVSTFDTQDSKLYISS